MSTTTPAQIPPPVSVDEATSSDQDQPHQPPSQSTQRTETDAPGRRMSWSSSSSTALPSPLFFASRARRNGFSAGGQRQPPSNSRPQAEGGNDALPGLLAAIRDALSALQQELRDWIDESREWRAACADVAERGMADEDDEMWDGTQSRAAAAGRGVCIECPFCRRFVNAGMAPCCLTNVIERAMPRGSRPLR